MRDQLPSNVNLNISTVFPNFDFIPLVHTPQCVNIVSCNCLTNFDGCFKLIKNDNYENKQEEYNTNMILIIEVP